jgi:hypothetical protein
VPSIPAGGRLTLYLRYGDGNVTGWTGKDVFDYFDDFSTGLSSSYVQEASGWTVSNGILVSPSGVSLNNLIHYPVSLSRSAGWAIRARVYISSSDSGVGFFWGSAGGGESSISGYIANYYSGATYSALRKYSSGSFTGLASLPAGLTGWFTVDFIANSTRVVVVRNGAVDAASSDTSITTLLGVGFRQGAASTPACDWWAVRKYSYPEPSTSLGGERLVVGGFVYSLPATYTVSILDSSLNTLGSATCPAGLLVVYLYPGEADSAQSWLLKLNSTLLYSAAFLNNTVLNPPQSGASQITFTVQDYGAGYQVLTAFDLQGRVAASGLITALGQVALNLTPYVSYMIQICKPGVCKAVGLVTISSSNIQLTVMPSIPAVKPPSWVSASYDYGAKQLIVNVSCASPPCNVTVRKILANGTQTTFAQLTCNTQLCGYALSVQDPFFLVTATDSSGKTAQASTGLSVPLWQSPLGIIVNTIGKYTNLDAFGVNINDFIIVLIGLGVIYAAFTFLTWEYAVLFLGIWLSIGTLLLGGSGRLVPPGIGLIVFGALLSLLLKKEKEV